MSKVAVNAGEQQQQKLHILLVPYQSVGHINPMLRLAQALTAEEDVLVTFGYPARFHSLACKRMNLDTSSSAVQSYNSMLRVEVVEDGLPLEEEQPLTDEHKRASWSIYQNAVKLLLDDLLHKISKPSSSSSSSSSILIAPLPPLCCIISDTFTPWTQDLADAAGIPRVEFWPSSAAAYSMGSQLSLLVSNGTLPLPKSSLKKRSVEACLIEGIPGLPSLPITDFPVEFVQAEEVSDFKLQFMLAAFGRAREAQTILVHSVYELESGVLDALQASGFPIHAVGPLPPTNSSASPSQHECMQWLDMQPPSSVIYVALGSIAKFSPAEMHALALGLHASGRPFLWVIRHDSISGSLSDALPEGFLQLTVDMGLGLIISWSPQPQVLSHRSVGAFFSHCGWNSTLECIWEGVPMVACPRAAEQRSNSRWIVENWKIGVELERQHDGSFTKEAVERALNKVLASEGLTYKENALHFKKVARSAVQKGGTSHSNLVNFLKCLHRSPHCDDSFFASN